MAVDPEIVKTTKVITFAPEHWGECERFGHFWPATYQFDKRTAGRLSGVTGHFKKAVVLTRLAVRLRPALAEDRRELDTQGFTGANRSAEFAAVVEEVLCELYASIECTTQVLSAIYGKLRGVPDRSSRKFFQRAAAGKFDDGFPPPLLAVLVEAHGWVAKLRALRDAITHAAPGSCSPLEGDKVAYFNQALGEQNRSLVIDDVFQCIDEHTERVNLFLGSVFRFLNATLKDDEVQMLCGIFGGRGFLRMVRPSEARDFSSGRCASASWGCPLANSCGAYGRAIDPRTEAVKQPGGRSRG